MPLFYQVYALYDAEEKTCKILHFIQPVKLYTMIQKGTLNLRDPHDKLIVGTAFKAHYTFRQ